MPVQMAAMRADLDGKEREALRLLEEVDVLNDRLDQTRRSGVLVYKHQSLGSRAIAAEQVRSAVDAERRVHEQSRQQQQVATVRMN